MAFGELSVIYVFKQLLLIFYSRGTKKFEFVVEIWLYRTIGPRLKLFMN